jgi:hypothetical protein
MTDEPKQDPENEFAAQVMQLAFKMGILIVESEADDDLVWVALLIHLRGLEARLRREFAEDRAPGAPKFADVRRSAHHVANGLLKHMGNIVTRAIPGIENMTEEELGRVIALMMVDEDDMAKS